MESRLMTAQEIEEYLRLKKLNEKDEHRDRVLTSAAIGFVTGSSVVGALVGGDFVGGLLGDFLEGTDDSVF